MALVGIELVTHVSEPDALTTRPLALVGIELQTLVSEPDALANYSYY